MLRQVYTRRSGAPTLSLLSKRKAKMPQHATRIAQHALRNTPVNGMPVPAGVVFEGNDWFYSEYAHGNGVSSLGIDGKSPEPDSADPEKKKILDMFKE